MFKFFKKSFLTGIFLLIPLGVTVFLVSFLLDNVGQPVSEIMFGWLDINIREKLVIAGTLNILSVLIVLLVITSIGWISNFLFGKMLIEYAEKIIRGVPGVNTIYGTIKQVVNTFGENRNAIFSKTVLIEYPRKGTYAVGFITSENYGETQEKTGQLVVNVFVPTTPNPTSGFLLLIPKKEIIELEMSITDGMKLVISGGVVVPPYKSKNNNKE